MTEGSALFHVPRSGFGAVRVWRSGARASIGALGLVLALPMGGIVLARGFDGLYGQDSYAYFDYATGSVRSSLLHLQPLEAFFWPPGYPLLVALTSLVLGPTPLAGQLVSLVMGALVPVLTALLARELWPSNKLQAILAGLLVGLCGQLWQSSVVVMADTTGLALATFAAWSLVRYGRSQHGVWLVAASAAVSYAMLARWIYGLVAVPFAAYAAYGWWAVSRVSRRRATLHGMAALVVALGVSGPILAAPLLGLLNRPGEPAPFAGNLQVYSWSPLNAFQRQFDTIDGHLAYAQRNGAYYALAPANLAYFGPLLAPIALLGLWPAFKSWPRRTLVLLVGWAAVVFAFHAGAPWQNFRFTLAYLPPLAILVAAGLTWTWRSVDRRIGWLVVLWVGLGLLSVGVGAVRLVEGFADRKDEELALVRWVQAQTTPDAQLLSFGPTLALRHYTTLQTLDLFDLSPDEVTTVLASRRPVYLLVDEANLASQWAAQAPGQNAARLEAVPGSTVLGTFASYTLYAVGAAT